MPVDSQRPLARVARVRLPLARSLIQYAERTVFAWNQLDPVSGAFIQMGDVLRWIVGVSGIGGSVQLPDVLEPRHLMQGLVGQARTVLGNAIIHDGDSRFERGKCLRNGSIRPAVMCNQVDIHRPDHLLRTGEIEERLAGQIPDIEKTKLAVTNDDTRRPRVLVEIT